MLLVLYRVTYSSSSNSYSEIEQIQTTDCYAESYPKIERYRENPARCCQVEKSLVDAWMGPTKWKILSKILNIGQCL